MIGNPKISSSQVCAVGFFREMGRFSKQWRRAKPIFQSLGGLSFVAGFFKAMPCGLQQAGLQRTIRAEGPRRAGLRASPQGEQAHPTKNSPVRLRNEGASPYASFMKAHQILPASSTKPPGIRLQPNKAGSSS